MIQIQDEKQLERAITKARQVKPLVRVVAFRFYTVTNKQTGAEYNIHFVKRDGQRLAWCTCKAGEKGQNCYHVAASLPIHLVLSAERASLVF